MNSYRWAHCQIYKRMVRFSVLMHRQPRRLQQEEILPSLRRLGTSVLQAVKLFREIQKVSGSRRWETELGVGDGNRFVLTNCLITTEGSLGQTVKPFPGVALTGIVPGRKDFDV